MSRPVRIHRRTGPQADGAPVYAIAVPREIAALAAENFYRAEMLPGGTIVFRPLVPIVEVVDAHA